nr:sulfhydryl oxidase 2-like isoform X2 [Ipomoea trifida]
MRSSSSRRRRRHVSERSSEELTGRCGAAGDSGGYLPSVRQRRSTPAAFLLPPASSARRERKMAGYSNGGTANEGNDGDHQVQLSDAVRRLAMEVRSLASARPITVLNGVLMRSDESMRYVLSYGLGDEKYENEHIQTSTADLEQMIKSETKASLITFLQLLVAHHPSKRSTPCIFYFPVILYYIVYCGVLYLAEDPHKQLILQMPRDKLTGELSTKYKQLMKVRIVPESALMNLDDAIMLFHDF